LSVCLSPCFLDLCMLFVYNIITPFIAPSASLLNSLPLLLLVADMELVRVVGMELELEGPVLLRMGPDMGPVAVAVPALVLRLLGLHTPAGAGTRMAALALIDHSSSGHSRSCTRTAASLGQRGGHADSPPRLLYRPDTRQTWAYSWCCCCRCLVVVVQQYCRLQRTSRLSACHSQTWPARPAGVLSLPPGVCRRRR